MACLFLDSGGHYGLSGTSNANLTKKYDNTGLALSYASTVILRPGAATSIYIGNSTAVPLTSDLFSSNGTFIWQGYIRFEFTGSAITEWSVIACGESGGSMHGRLRLTSSKTLRVQRADGTYLGSAGSTVLQAGAWYRLQFKYKIHDSTGTYDVKLDGATEITGSGADTRNGGGGTWDMFQMTGAVTGPTYVSDLAVFDTSGGAPCNDFLPGNWRVDVSLPKTDAVSAGANADFTPSTGSDHGALVDENPGSSADYNGSAVVNDKDTYKFTAPNAGSGDVYAVQVNILAFKSDAGARTCCAVARTGGTDYDGAAFSPQTNTRYFRTVWEEDPDTSAPWVDSDIVEFGMKVVS